MPSKLRTIANNQAGIVSRQQALISGMTRGMIDAKVRSGWWQPFHTGMYKTFTGEADRNARLWAAVLSAGTGAYLSHETAAEINGLMAGPSMAINVTIPASRRVVALEGVHIHLSSRRPMVWTPPGVPPYSIAEETVLDLVQAIVDKDEVVALITSGFNRRLLTENHLSLDPPVKSPSMPAFK